MYKNNEGYPDPTAGAALKHIEYEEYFEKRSIKTSWYGIFNIASLSQDSREDNGLNEHYCFQAEP